MSIPGEHIVGRKMRGGEEMASLKGSWVVTEGCVHGDGMGLDREDFTPQW